MKSRITVLWFARFFTTAGLTVMIPLLPLYLAELGASQTMENRLWTGATLAAPAFMSVCMAPIWGAVGDRCGRKLMVVRALFGVGVTLLLMGFAVSVWQFFVLRLLQGLVGGVDDAVVAFAGSRVRKELYGRILGTLHSATAAGALVGPLIGGAIIGVAGFQPVMLVMGGLISMAGIAAWILLQEKPWKPTFSSFSPVVPWNNVSQSLFHNSRTLRFLVAGCLTQIGLFGLVTIYAPHVASLLDHAGQSATWVGLLQGILWGAAMITAPWWGKANNRISTETVFALAAILGGISIILQTFPDHPIWLIPLRVLQGVALGALMPSVMLIVNHNSEEKQRGVHVGQASSVLVSGQIIGALSGGILGIWLSTTTMITLMGFVVFLSFLCMVRVNHAGLLQAKRTT